MPTKANGQKDGNEWISIRGARTHNLKNIDLDIPRNQFVVITGVSGSGKSSLAFDTLYAEGQRRYIESLSVYARQFLNIMDRPDVDSIDGLSPAISIEQKTRSHNPRSTVGTVTEIYDYMRLLFARIGVPHSPTTGAPIEAQSVDQMASRIAEFGEGKKFYVLAPIIRDRKGEYKKELQHYAKQGFQRVMIDSKVYDISATPSLEKNDKHTIALVVDRLILPHPSLIAGAWRTRLISSLEAALKVAVGIVWIQGLDEKEPQKLILSEKFACPVSGFALESIEPRLFSFNAPQGACPQCGGMGEEAKFDPYLVIDWSLSLEQGAVTCLTDEILSVYRMKSVRTYYQKLLEALAVQKGISTTKPFNELPEEHRNIILQGTGDEPVPLLLKIRHKQYNFNKPFEGVIPILSRRFQEANETLREILTPLQKTCECSQCHGTRLKPEALCIKVQGKNIAEISDMSVECALAWFNSLHLGEKQLHIAEKIIHGLMSRLTFLKNVGLDYLTLSRKSCTLSGGESQRIRLASQIGAGLTGVLYVLDEPSIGLHQRDNDRLLATIKHLRDLGNSVIVVEHDEDAIRNADWIVDIGPEAGVLGGQVTAQGPLSEILKARSSLTADYLSKRKTIALPQNRRPVTLGSKTSLKVFEEKRKRMFGRTVVSKGAPWRGVGNPSKWGDVPWLRIEGAKANNLKNLTVDIPLGRFVCITGVSGSGKSSLVMTSLLSSVENIFNNKPLEKALCSRILGIENIDKIIDIDQGPIGRTPRSNPATYVKCFTGIRDWFAMLPEAKARGYSSSRFSFNVKGGRCEACQGEGVLKIEMHFLSDVYVECDQCHGKRYNQETLSIKYKDKNIYDVLTMTIDEGVSFFENLPGVWLKLKQLQDVGVGYLSIGHAATLLSGGEAQRIKLAKELSRKSTGNTLYILDEPTTGLHFEDVRKLLEVLNKLVDQGNSILVIEHNLEVIKTADWIIDLGPEGGQKGGTIIAEGTPEDIVKNGKSYTGKYLRPYLTTEPLYGKGRKSKNVEQGRLSKLSQRRRTAV